MTVTAYINRELGIRVHRIAGRTTAREFLLAVSFYKAHPDHARTDLITFVDENVDVSDFPPGDLDELRAAFQSLYKALDLQIVLRSAWICPSVCAWPLIEDWLRNRHSRDAMATEVSLVTRLEEASDLFDASELAAVRAWTGFELLATFSDRCGA